MQLPPAFEATYPRPVEVGRRGRGPMDRCFSASSSSRTRRASKRLLHQLRALGSDMWSCTRPVPWDFKEDSNSLLDVPVPLTAVSCRILRAWYEEWERHNLELCSAWLYRACKSVPYSLLQQPSVRLTEMKPAERSAF